MNKKKIKHFIVRIKHIFREHEFGDWNEGVIGKDRCAFWRQCYCGKVQETGLLPLKPWPRK